MFSGAQSGVLFSGAATQNNAFGQASNTATGYFGSTNQTCGTTISYQPLDSTDTIQKNNQNVNIITKLHCLTAMKAYESKSIEELRSEDYQANRLTKTSNTMFPAQQNTGMMNSQPTMFSSFASNQQNQSSLFGNTNQQANTFGNKPLFSGTNTAANATFGAFNNQSKPSSLFSSTNNPNKPLFANTPSQQTGGIFGSSAVSSTSTLFGTQQMPVQSSSFFGTSQQSQAQPNQSTGLFGNTSTGSFGFATPANTSLFGAANKGFGTTGGFISTSSTAPVFGSTTSTAGSLFGQQSQSTGFGTAAKAPLFSSTFQPQTAANQGTSLFGQTSSTPIAQPGLFGNQQKPTTAFGSPTIFPNATSKPSLFGNVTNTPFSSQAQGFGAFGSTTQPFNAQTATTSTAAPTIGYSNPAEALIQQQMTQQKILSLVSNRPYGVNKLFLGQSLNPENFLTSNETTTNNTNIMSLAIKRGDTDQFGMISRRNVLNQRTKIVPNKIYKVFNGFDDEDEKSGNIEKHFFTKRDDWKYLPPNAFDKPRSSLNSNNAMMTNASLTRGCTFINGNSSINSNNESGYQPLLSSPVSSSDKFYETNKSTHFSTPKPNLGRHAHELLRSESFSPIHSTELKVSFDKRANDDEKWIGASSFNIEDKSEDKAGINGSHSLYHKTEEIVENESEISSCNIKLTKNGYYTAPSSEVLNKLVTKNEDGELECWIENFIIGRRSFGSIRFPGLTNVYGLNFDKLVDIREKEVSVYPDDENKPEEGEEINKLAQIILQEVWPTDKSTKQIIMDEQRLSAMNFEDKLRRVTEKMGARFISYAAPKGVWVFEVDHFSKYRYDESDEENDSNMNENKVEEHQTRTTDVRGGELVTHFDRPKDFRSPIIISAEADSMTNFPNEDERPIMKNGLQRFYDSSNNQSVHRMKQNLFKYDEDDYVHSPRKFDANFSQKEEPRAKRLETMENGLSMLNSSFNNSTNDCNKQSLLIKDSEMADAEYSNNRKIKPLATEHVATTKLICTSRKTSKHLKIPIQFRDIKSIKMPYLPLKLLRYFDTEETGFTKNVPLDAGMCQGNRFRVGFHMSSNKDALGLNFFRKDNSNHSDTSFSSLAIIRHENVRCNGINVMKLAYDFSDYQEQLLQSALLVSKCSVGNSDDCPLWQPMHDSSVLNKYVDVQNQQKDPHVAEVHTFGRIVSLCNALWSEIGDKDVQSPTYLKHLERKQSLSKWIRMESRHELIKKVEQLCHSSPAIDVTKCNDIILESLCCGEIKLACKLATMTKQHRMALLISQSAGSIQKRILVREQLNLWIADKTDQNIPFNIMCIYVLLSGLTTVTTSDGSIITPMKQLKWYQAFGCYQWFIQPYLDPIKSCLDLYEEDFKTDLDIPAPFPINAPGESVDDYYSYHDVCFHLLKLSCDSLHNLDVLLNPPTISRSNDHKLSLDWSCSWHLSNILCSLNHNIPSNDKLCHEWAAQLERGGQWQWAVFVLLHIENSKVRHRTVKNVILRNASGTRHLLETEAFVVDRLRVPLQWLHEAKAVCCKNLFDVELEAYHWFMVGDYEKSHRIYVDEIFPQLVLNDRFDKMSELLTQFTSIGVNKRLPSWPNGGGLYLRYLSVMHRVHKLRVANKLMKYAALDEEKVVPEIILEQQNEEGDFEAQLEALKTEVGKLRSSLVSHVTGIRDSDVKIISKRQMETMCTTLLKSWIADENE